MSRQRFSAEQWRAWFVEFSETELTVQQFCDSKGIAANTFYNWRRRLRETPDSVSAGRTSSATSFVSVKLSDSRVEFEFPGGVTVRVVNNHDSLRPLVELLREPGGSQ